MNKLHALVSMFAAFKAIKEQKKILNKNLALVSLY